MHHGVDQRDRPEPSPRVPGLADCIDRIARELPHSAVDEVVENGGEGLPQRNDLREHGEVLCQLLKPSRSDPLLRSDDALPPVVLISVLADQELLDLLLYNGGAQRRSSDRFLGEAVSLGPDFAELGCA